MGRMSPFSPDTDGPFWCHAIGSAAAQVPALACHLDALAQRAAHLPQLPTLTRPVVGQYLSVAQALAAAWHQLHRPALLAAMAVLSQFGAGVGHACELDTVAARRLVEALQRRLAAPLAALGALAADFAHCRNHMARMARELDADARLVGQRLQADQVQLFLLARQASALQSCLDGPHDRGALEQAQRQLAQLRLEQAATRAEADYLHSLQPTLAPLLATFERMGSVIDAILAGALVLATRLAQLKGELADGASAATASGQLAAALPHWQALAAAAACLG